MSVASHVNSDPPIRESVYVVQGDTPPDAIARSLQALVPARHRPIARQRVALLDTVDGRVRRAGGRLTRAGAIGASDVTWQPRGRREVAARLSRPPSFAWDLPDGPLRQTLAPVIGARRLLAQADAEKHGSLLEVLDDRGKIVARVRIESGRVRSSAARSAWQPLPTIVTLTSLRGYDDVYARLVPVIESRPGVTSCPEGFHGFVLRHAGAPEPGVLSLPQLDLPPTVRADVGACQIHRALLGLLQANEPGLRANVDTEFLHDFRVAVRRTRSLLGQLKGVFPAEAVERFSAEFSWLGRLTNAARDLDVLVLALREHEPDLSVDDRNALMAFLATAQEREHHTLIDALECGRYRRLIADWQLFLEQPAEAGPDAPNGGRPLTAVISRRAWRLSKRIAAITDTVDEHTPVPDLHAVRVDAKKLRYLIDVAPGFYDAADLDRILDALKKLQRALGDFNDADVQEARLLDAGRAWAADGAPAGALLTLGRLAERCRARRESLRGVVVKRLRRFGSRATRAACRRAFRDAALADQAP